jgi:hypothetical protein
LITSSIVTYLSETQFYSFIASLFSNKENIPKQGKIEKIPFKDGPVMEETS